MPPDVESILMERTRLMQMELTEIKEKQHDLEKSLSEFISKQNDKCSTRYANCMEKHTDIKVSVAKIYVVAAIAQTVLIGLIVKFL